MRTHKIISENNRKQLCYLTTGDIAHVTTTSNNFVKFPTKPPWFTNYHIFISPARESRVTQLFEYSLRQLRGRSFKYERFYSIANVK